MCVWCAQWCSLGPFTPSARPHTPTGSVYSVQTAPAWATFTAKPKLGNLTDANIVVPTVAGPVAVNATPETTSVVVPPNTMATICVRGGALTLDGASVDDATISGAHACARAGSGAGGRLSKGSWERGRRTRVRTPKHWEATSCWLRGTGLKYYDGHARAGCKRGNGGRGWVASDATDPLPP